MGRVAVIYEGKYGSTEQYARWICEETGGELFRVGTLRAADLADFDTVVFGGCVHAGGIQGIDKFRKLYPDISDKQVLTFAVGLMVEDEAARAECRELNFFKKESSFKMLLGKGRGRSGMSEEEKAFSRLPLYFFRGAYDPAKVSGMDKTMIGVVKKMIAGKRADQRTGSEEELLVAIEHGADYVDRDAINELVKAVNGSCSK